MRPTEKQRRNCRRKKRYDRFMDARADAKKLSDKPPRQLTQAYYCDVCAGYHVGRNRATTVRNEQSLIPVPAGAA